MNLAHLPEATRKMVSKSASFDSEGAGWYVPNSVGVWDIYPDWRIAGGGVSKRYLTPDLKVAFEQAIIYTRHRIAQAELHLEKLKAAQGALNNGDV